MFSPKRAIACRVIARRVIARRVIACRAIVCFVLFLIVPIFLLSQPAGAVFVTPGTGVHWTMADLVDQSGGAVTGADPIFTVHEHVQVATTDTLSIRPGEVLAFIEASGGNGLRINGCLLAMGAPQDSVIMTADAQESGTWDGLEFEDTAAGSGFVLRYCLIEFAEKAVDVFGADIDVAHCTINFSSEKVFEFGDANGEVRNCRIMHNRKQTITMTLGSSPLIQDCWFENNNALNASPYPYINIGLQGNNSPTVRGNTILGSGHQMSGGMAIWNECNGLIEGNTISGCGYGILCYQFDANPLIKDNVLTDNNIHPDTLNWGFGIACNGQNAPIITGNSFSGHWYGIALINGAQPNVGDLINDFPDDDGMNRFLGNGLDGELYELYNNTSNEIMAQNNWWDTTDVQEIADRIVDFSDDPDLGVVVFEPFFDPTGVSEDLPTNDATLLGAVTAYPNPFNPRVNLAFRLQRDAMVRVTVHDAAGRLLGRLQDGPLSAGDHSLSWQGVDRGGRALPSGAYFYRITAEDQGATGKLLLVR